MASIPRTSVSFCIFFLGVKGSVCQVGETPDKELPGIVAARGDTV